MSDMDEYARGEALLRSTNCQRGWEQYDLHPSRPQDRLRAHQRWDGEQCEVLVIVAEQGFGDAIQFLRFVPAIVSKADRVVVAMHDELVDVVASSPLLQGVEVISKSEARRAVWPQGMRWERMLSLPMRVAELSIDPIGQYLQVPQPRRALRLSAEPTIGVAWRSTTRHGFASRSFPARLVKLLSYLSQMRIVALHRTEDITTNAHGAEVVDIRGFADTAAVIGQCDYVVTADTVTAHLAPALGVPTLICLRHCPDWRWGTPSRPTDWYASAELLFQGPDLRWDPVISAAARRIFESRRS